tara:strand:+ start:247 stop:1359 length:1113 start_codon:yes stop_codon:yes gene_type:complete
MLLADGNVVYNGPADTAVDYFANLTDPCPSRYNPADYLLELLVERKDKDGETPLKLRLIEEYKKTEEKCAAVPIPAREDDDENDSKWPASWLEQAFVLGRRSMQFKFDRAVSFLPICQSIGMILICMVVWFDMSFSEDTLRDRAGLLFFSVVWFSVFPMTSTVLAFCSDRQVLEKERAVGSYRLSAYVLSRMAAENPVDVIFVTLFCTVVYWTSNLSDSVGSFFALWTLFIFVSMAGQAAGQCFGSTFLDLQRAMTLTLVYFLFCMLIGGYYTQDIPDWISWGKYLSPVYFAFDLALIIVFHDDDLEFYRGQMGYWNRNQYPVSGKLVLKDFFGVDKDDFVTDIIAIGLFIFGFTFLGYLSLRFLNRPKT